MAKSFRPGRNSRRMRSLPSVERGLYNLPWRNKDSKDLARAALVDSQDDAQQVGSLPVT